MRFGRAALEGGLNTATAAAVCMCLTREQNGPFRAGLKPQAAVSIAVLAILACSADRLAEGLAAARYQARPAESSGVGLGILALPCLLGGLAAAAGADAGAYALPFYAGLASAALQLCLVCWPAPSKALGSSRRHNALRSRQGPPGALARGSRAALVWAAGALAIGSPLPGGLSIGSWVLALSAAALACLAFHAAMVCLPRTFTLGEAMALSQGTVLLACNILHIVLGCSQRGSPPAGWTCPASQFQAFVGCMVLGVTVLAAALAALVARPRAGPKQQPPPPLQQVDSKEAKHSNGRHGLDALAGTGTQHSTAATEEPRSQGGHGRTQGGHFSAHSAEQQSGGRVGASLRQKGPGLPAWRVVAALVLLVAGCGVLVKPALWSIAYAISTRRRAGMLVYWVVLMALSLPGMAKLSASRRVPNIIIRKGYHILANALFLPAAALEPALLGVSLAIAFALLLVLELARVTGAPFIGPIVHEFMTSFIDSRDWGAMLVTHFSLLLGMAVPLWLSNAMLEPPGDLGPQLIQGWNGSGAGEGAMGVPPLWPAGVSGIMILGFGDTAASVVGRRLGRHPICAGSKKTWEGTAGGLGATLLGWWLISACTAWQGGNSATSSSTSTSNTTSSSTGITGLGVSWPMLIVATALSSLLEALTTQLDNLFVPLHYLTLLCCGIATARGA